MSTFAKSFKDEVTRLARKEAKAAVAPIRKPSGANRSALADLKRRVAALEKETRRLAALLAKVPQPAPAPAAGDQKARITGKGMRSLRRKLRLSAEQFGRLLGITAHGVYFWERKDGPIRVRQTTRAALLSIRTLGAREAKARLQTLAKK
jgi:lysozyme family protein